MYVPLVRSTTVLPVATDNTWMAKTTTNVSSVIDLGLGSHTMGSHKYHQSSKVLRYLLDDNIFYNDNVARTIYISCPLPSCTIK